MSETQENQVISLCEFRKRHPVPSGKLIRDPYCKSRINQDKAPIERTDPAKQSKNRKLQEAMQKYGSFTGNAQRNQNKDKIKLEGDQDV